MSRYFLLLVVGVAISVDGYLYGRLTGRWRDSHELSAAVARLDRVPMNVGDWEGEALTLDPKVVEVAGFRGYIVRRYSNRRTGNVVSLLVACGRPGPLALHTPDACYRCAGFRMMTEEAKQTLDPMFGRIRGECRRATFAREDGAAPERLRVVWSWYSNGTWSAPDNPRWTFAGQPVIHKLYITQEYFPRDEETDGAACLEFFRDLYPELETILTPDH
jgi:hypothetical protein